MNKREEEEFLTRYYLEQSGHGSELYTGQLYQKGQFVCAHICHIFHFHICDIFDLWHISDMLHI